jgi:hypothetical protein
MKGVPTEAGKEPDVKKAEPVPTGEKPPAGEAATGTEAAGVKPAKGEGPVEEKVLEKKALEEKGLEERPGVFPEVRSAGFVGDVNLRGIGIILDNRDGKNLLSEGDIVYLGFRTADPVNVGNKYTIFRGHRLVKHPVTHRNIGRKYAVLGTVQVIDQQGNFYTGKIVESFQEILTGDMLRPYLKDK